MFYIDTTDQREQILKELLLKDGYTAKDFVESDNFDDNATFVFSPANKNMLNIAKILPNKCKVFCGAVNDEVKQIFASKQIEYKNLMQDEIFTIKNANLTTEGVLALILQKSQNSLFENKVLILGFGRIAQALAILLQKLGIEFALVSYNSEKFPKCYTFCPKNYFKTSFLKDVKNYDIIVNTIPAQILDSQMLQEIACGTIFIETASVPCLEAEYAKHFEYVKAPALPTKYCAQAAATLMKDNILGRNNYEQ